jgi:hypothetical protein
MRAQAFHVEKATPSVAPPDRERPASKASWRLAGLTNSPRISCVATLFTKSSFRARRATWADPAAAISALGRLNGIGAHKKIGLGVVHAKYPGMVVLHGCGGVGVPRLYSAAAALLRATV